MAGLSPEKAAELALVIPTRVAGALPLHGLLPEGSQRLEGIVREHYQFKPRGEVEEDPRYLQIIPQWIIKSRRSLMLMERSHRAADPRIRGAESLAVGGHIKPDDFDPQASLFEWGKAELDEEIRFNSPTSRQFLGLVHDRSTMAGQVHLGAAILVESQTQNVDLINGEFKSARWMSFPELRKISARIGDTWTQIMFSHLYGLRMAAIHKENPALEQDPLADSALQLALL